MKKVKSIKKSINKNINSIIVYNELDKNFILEKNHKNKKIETKTFLKTHKILKNNLNKKIEEEYRKIINNFFNKLSRKLPHCNFDNLNNNISSLKIRLSKNYRKYVVGSYYPMRNRIKIREKNDKSTFYHELLHMASRKYINKHCIISGFKYSDFNKNLFFGNFINEGYTEYLNTKYFSINNICYKSNISIVIILEKIIGKELMEKMYFNADVIGLINELMKYDNTLDSVIEFIINTDYIHKNQYTLNPIKKLKLKSINEKVNVFLVKTYRTKLKRIRENNEEFKITHYRTSGENILNLVSDNKLYISFFEKLTEETFLMKMKRS